MKYTVKEIAEIINAKTKKLTNDSISILLTDSRRLSYPEESLFFAIKTKTNDGHNYIGELYRSRVRNFVVGEMRPEFEAMTEANFLLVKDVVRALQQLARHYREQRENSCERIFVPAIA